ncbi:MAG: Wzz/FepE/Etk N-terminal domain-containing protein [Desulfobacteraceae bacterium]|jgi:uncharacterized protein involved in exopolysaccharide biosynthesis
MPSIVNDRLNEGYEDEIDLAALFLVVWGYRKLIAIIVISLVFLVISLSLITARKYTASTSIINMVDNSRVIKNFQQGFDFDTEIQSPKNNILLAILKSETLAERVIKRANLLPHLFPKRWDSEKKEWKTKFDEKVPTEKMGMAVLKRMIKIKSTENDPTITISVTTRNPELSPMIANTYTKELEEYLKLNSFSTVQKSRIFLEGKLKDSQEDLEDLKKKLEDFQQENGVFDLDQQAEASMAAYNELALRLNKKETEQAYTQSVSSPTNPKVQNLGMQIAAIKAKMNNLKNGGGADELIDNAAGSSGKTQNFLPLNRISQLRMQLQRMAHNIEIQQKTTDLLIDSYEKITIQEAKEKIFVTVLDQAEVPIRPDSKRTLIKIFLAIFGGVFFGVCLAFGIEFIKKQMEVRFDEIEKTGNPGDGQEPFSVISYEDKASKDHSQSINYPEQQMKD